MIKVLSSKVPSKKVEAKHVVVALTDDVEGTIKASELSIDKVEDARNVVKEGEEIEVRVVSVDRKNRTIGLSVKAIALADEKEAVKALKEKAQGQCCANHYR